MVMLKLFKSVMASFLLSIFPLYTPKAEDHLYF